MCNTCTVIERDARSQSTVHGKRDARILTPPFVLQHQSPPVVFPTSGNILFQGWGVRYCPVGSSWLIESVGRYLDPSKTAYSLYSACRKCYYRRCPPTCTAVQVGTSRRAAIVVKFYTLNTQSRQSSTDLNNVQRFLLANYLQLDNNGRPIPEEGYYRMLEKPREGIDAAEQKEVLKYVRLVYHGHMD